MLCKKSLGCLKKSGETARGTLLLWSYPNGI